MDVTINVDDDQKFIQSRVNDDLIAERDLNNVPEGIESNPKPSSSECEFHSNNSLNVKPIILTKSQVNLVETCIKLLPEFKILVIKGDSASGKYVVASELFRRVEAIVELFDLCYLAKYLEHEISNQDLLVYFDELIFNIKKRITARQLGIIYIRYYNRIIDVLGDHNAKSRFLLPLILKTVIDSMPENIRIVITTQGCLLPETMHWCVDLITTRADMEHVLQPYRIDGTISELELQSIMKLSKTIPVGRILFCLRYAIAMSRNETKDDTALIEAYKKALGRFSGATVDVDKDVPNPIPEDELIGVEDIMDEIITSIVTPMQLNIPGISIKKGLLLCGPPGTGKTSLGRWLAHKIKGKFYLISGEVAISGPDLVNAFQSTVRKANENAPAVIFLDDGDSLFEHEDTYRAFLMVLDGIETNKRKDVCVIVTCMNMKRIPASLLRGGRLEMALITRLPDHDKIQIILNRALRNMLATLSEYKPEVAETITKYLERKSFISDLALKMVGWNCADINRCVSDVSRLIISNKGTELNSLFAKCIRQIKLQYELCGKCESTNLDDRPQDVYIS